MTLGNSTGTAVYTGNITGPNQGSTLTINGQNGVQTLGGLLLLINRYVPLAIAILGPVIVNILCFHALMAPAGLPLAIVVTAMWFIVFARNKQYFAPLFTARTA